MRRRRLVVGVVLASAATLLAGQAVSGWFISYQWFQSLGADSLWWARTNNLLLLRGGAFAAGATFTFLNLLVVQHSVASIILPRRIGDLQIGEEVPGSVLSGIVAVLALVTGLALAIPLNDWISLELIRNGARFGESDPYFQADMAFWLYWLPLEKTLHVWAIVAVALVTFLCLGLYALTPSLRWEEGRLRVSGYVRKHCVVLGGLLLLLVAWQYRLDGYGVLLEGNGVRGSFVAVDHRVRLPANLVLALGTVVAAMMWTWAGWMGKLRLAMATLGGLFILSLGLRQVLPPLSTRFLSSAEADARDRPYLTTTASYSRRAFDADRVIDADTSFGNEQISARFGAPALWDPVALRRAASFLRLRGRAVGVLGWEGSSSRLRAFTVEQPSGPEAFDPLAAWGIAGLEAELARENGAVLVDEVESALPSRLAPALVYEGAEGHLAITDSSDAVRAPLLATLMERLAHAWGLQDLDLLTNRGGRAGVKVLRIRDVQARVAELYPFFDRSPATTPIVFRDSLWYAVHLYSASEFYPLSVPLAVPTRDARYFRHAAVVLINAHTGATTAISDGSPDPIALSWTRRLPALFTTSAAVDEGLLQRIPPPIEAALAQARVFARVGRRGTFEPPSRIPTLTGSDTLFAFPANAMYPDAERMRLRVSYPIVDASERLRGAIVATGGADYEPRWVPTPLAPDRWPVILERMRRALDSAAASVASSASRTQRGPVRTVVVDGRLSLVQTAYVWPVDGPPTPQFVAAFSAGEVQVAAGIRASLGLQEPLLPLTPATPEAVRARAQALHQQMRAALGRGDWVAFGAAFDELGRLLRAGQGPP